jgi:hypothetical protein
LRARLIRLGASGVALGARDVELLAEPAVHLEQTRRAGGGFLEELLGFLHLRRRPRERCLVVAERQGGVLPRGRRGGPRHDIHRRVHVLSMFDVFDA